MLRLDVRWAFRRVAALAVVAAFVVVAAPAVVATGSGLGAAVLASSSAPPADSRAAQAWATRMLGGMSLDEKIGQLFVTYAYGDRVDTDDPADVANNRAVYGVDNAAALIEKYHLGGIIYFTRFNNVNNPRQIAELSNGIQRVAADQRSSIPMLISTDQEQGLVARVGPPATQFPGNMALGAGRSPSDAYDAARITGEELSAIGINQDLAPVADVNVNALNPVIGVRSFAENTKLVSQLTSAQVEGYQDADVAATAKHFPGHGDTTVDSHTGIPVINHSRQQWERIDLPPFQAAIERGVDSIMTAHIVVPSLDPSGDPATLSEPIMTGLLRKELHYDGVVVTDALDMAGVREKYGDDRVPVLALKAGVDQLLMPPNLDLAYQAVRAAVHSDEISERRIDQSVHRILRLKFQRGLFHDPYVDVDAIDGVVGTPEHLARAQQIADRTTTLIKDDVELIPLAQRPRSVLVTGWGATTT
ncbi:MAG TPA: glycoside hydrolase family 3 protein, partial [Pseudonocardiaceae bacterium]|nr:glycoside hydrolase family 3 protein [Pseudonocardiaceae bacterium]